jgi:hypothetical protein
MILGQGASMRHAIRFALVVVAFLLFTNSASAATLACTAATTLDALANCVKNQIPANGSGEWIAATATEQTAWRSVVNQMLNGSCSVALPAAIAIAAQIRTFTDSATGRNYCLLMEVLDANNNGKVDRGWGAFMVNASATLEISHQAPHPLADLTTENQSIGVFGGTDSRSWLMAGAHRMAATGSNACQSSYGASDAAHAINNMFHATNLELMSFYGNTDWQAIQWHGMAADTCSPANAFLSHGRTVNPAATDKNLLLKNSMISAHPTWVLETPVSSCSLNATDNVQGRLINGVPEASVCGTAASSYNGKFLHIEQDPGFRTASDWISSVTEVWSGTPPPSPTPPAAPTGVSATSATKRKITVAWAAVAGATSYTVKRATISGGPYTTVGTATTTSFTNGGLTSGVSYYYVVSASNAQGQGPNSTQVSAIAR